MPNSISEIAAIIRTQAQAEGFDAVRFTAPTLPSQAGEDLRRFLDDGSYGEMGWLANHAEKRADPKLLWPDVASIIVLAMRYPPPDNTGIAAYARGDDYHDIIKKKLKKLGGWIVQTFGGDVKVFVDTAPVLEKALAEQAGIGWQGKHTNLIRRDAGTWFFLAEIFTTLPLPPDAPAQNHCGACSACLAVCPTGALTGPGQMDARLCISYLTIEHKGPIPRHLRAKIGTHLYGCDDCLAVCPWNKFAEQAHEEALMPRKTLQTMTIGNYALLDDAGFRVLFRASPIKRIGRDRFVRNALTVIGNSRDLSLAEIAEALTSDDAPLVRGAAIWALQRLAPLRAAALAAQRITTEPEQSVCEEWQATITAPITVQ